MASGMKDRRSKLSPDRQALFAKRLSALASSVGAKASGRPQPPHRVEEDRDIGSRPGPAPASFGQQRLWYFASRQPDSVAYHLYYAFGLRGPLDAETLARGVRAVIERHEALRTHFEVQDGAVVAVTAPELVPSHLPLVDLGGLPDSVSRDSNELRFVAELATPRFDLERGPLLRTVLVRATPQEHWLVLAVHHAVIDGWSLALFTRDLAEAYAALADGRPPFSALQPLQSGDFARWQRGRVETGALAEDLEWWRRRLAGAPPSGFSSAIRPQTAGGRSMLRLGPDITQSLKHLAQRQRVTLFITLLAGLDALLHHWTGRTDLIVGTPVALRGQSEAGNIMGYLLNLLPLRTDLSGDPTFLDLLGRARDTFLGALAHCEPPIEWLAEKLLPGHQPGEVPWIRVLFNMPSGGAGHTDPVRVRGVEIRPLLTGEMGSELDLTFYAREVAGGIRLDLGYNANLLAPGEPARLLAGYTTLLREAAAQPQRHLSELAGSLLFPAGAGA